MRYERRRPAFWPAIIFFSCTALLVAGCASPGSPRPPSLQLPQAVSDLSAVRSGDAVQIHFTVPSRTTDGQRLRQSTVRATLCRQDAPGTPCIPVDTSETAAPLAVPAENSAPPQVAWTDVLPTALAAGPSRPIAYRVELRTEQGHSGGASSPAYTAAGAAPLPVLQFAAEGTRPGVLLRWAPAQGTGEVLLARQEVNPVIPKLDATSPTPASSGEPRSGASRHHATGVRGSRPSRASTPGLVWLEAGPGTTRQTEMIDGTATEGVRYRYTAVRREVTRVGGRTLELRSSISSPVEITWQDVYPPAAPQNLTALGYTTGQAIAAEPSTVKSQPYAVDLIWQPVNDPRVTGYIVTRVDMSAPAGSPQRLTTPPVTTPAFHDTTADPSKSYRYEVTAVDAKGNVSRAATATVQAFVR